MVLNGQHSSWSDVNEIVRQGSILIPLFFLVYSNDLPNGLKSNTNLFAHDASLFPIIHDVNLSQADLNEDLDKIKYWAYQWKMIFNPRSSKKARGNIYSKTQQFITSPLGMQR